MSGEKVSIGVEVTGVQQARTEMDGLVGAMSGLFNGLNQSSQGAVPSFHASSNSTQVTQPNIPAGGSGTINPNLGGGGNLQSLIGVLGAPAQSFNTGRVSPGMVTSATLSQNGSNAAGTGAFGNGGGVLQVQIVSSIPLNFTGGSGNGGGQGGGQGGGFSGAGGGNPFQSNGGQGGGQGGGTPAHPYTGGFNPFNANGINNIARTALGFAQNPGALMEMIPAPLALGAAVITTGFQAASANYASYRPKYDLETSLLAAPERGQLVSPLLRAAQEKVAADRGDQAYYESHRSTIYGLAGRIGSLGIADWYYNTRIRPGIDRRTEIDQAKEEGLSPGLRFKAATGSMPGVTDGSLGIQNGLFGSVGAFGSRAIASLGNTSFKSLTDKGWSSEDAQGVGSTVLGVAMSQQSGALYGQLAGGANMLGMASSALPGLIAKGDVGAINSLRPQIGSAATDAAISQARQTFALNVTSQIDQSKFSSLGSQVSLLGATGAGYRQIAGAVGTQSNSLDAVKGDLQKRMGLAAAAGNTADVAAIGAQINQANAQQAQMQQQAAMTVFSGRGVETQTLSAGAGNQMYRAMYGGGGQGGVDAAFGAQGRAGMAEAQRLEDMSKSPFISPEQRALYAQQAIQQRQQSTIGVDRERSSYDYGITQGKIGVRGATAQSALTQSQMFGDSGAIYGADMGMASVTGAQLNAVRGRLNDPTAHLSEQESLSLKREEISLQREYNQQLTQASRSFFSLNANIAHTSEGILSVGANVQLGMERIGGSRASGIVGGMVGAASGSLRADQASLDNLIKQGVSPNSQQYKAAQAQVAQDQAGLTGRLMSYSDLSPSLGVQSAMSQADFELNMAGKAFLPVGNRRQALDNKLNATGQAGKEMNAQYRAQVADIKKNLSGQDQKDALDAAAFNFQQKRQGLAMNAADTMQNLASNWMDQNISNVVNAPSRMSFVSSQFTQRQAAPYFQAMGDIYGGQYGFAGKGAEGSRNEVMDRFHRFGNMTIGNINTSEGFRNTALSGMTGTLHPASTEVRVILEDHRTTVVSGGKSQTVNHPGGNANTIQAIGNGSLTQSGSTHNLSGGSHQ